MKFVAPAVDSYFIHESFAVLAPKDQDNPYPQKSQKMIVVPLASQEYVAVAAYDSNNQGEASELLLTWDASAPTDPTLQHAIR